jgi:hypothetical protein
MSCKRAFLLTSSHDKTPLFLGVQVVGLANDRMTKSFPLLYYYIAPVAQNCITWEAAGYFYPIINTTRSLITLCQSAIAPT